MDVTLATHGNLAARVAILAKGLESLVKLDCKYLTATELLITGQCTPENPLVGRLKSGASIEELRAMCEEYGIMLDARDD